MTAASLIDQLEALRVRINSDEQAEKLYLLQYTSAKLQENEEELIGELRKAIDSQASRAAVMAELVGTFTSRIGFLPAPEIRHYYVNGDPQYGLASLPPPLPQEPVRDEINPEIARQLEEVFRAERNAGSFFDSMQGQE